MINDLVSFVRKWWPQSFETCVWKVSGRRRYCVNCRRRQVFDGRSWVAHEYPLDADPHRDPTPIIDARGNWSTMGFEQWYGDVMEGMKK